MTEKTPPAEKFAPALFLTQRFIDAVAYATALHATQTRKGSDIPYISHLLGVASLVLEAGGSENAAIGALLHDAAEDQGGHARLHDIRARFGPEVAEIVQSCSDYLGDDPANKPPWPLRKSDYLHHLEFEASGDTLIVAIADKVHNARSIHTDLQREGVATMGRFNADFHQTIWYYESCLRIAERRGVTRRLTEPLRIAIEGIRGHHT